MLNEKIYTFHMPKFFLRHGKGNGWNYYVCWTVNSIIDHIIIEGKFFLKVDCIPPIYSLLRVISINLWNDYYPLIGILILSLTFVDCVIKGGNHKKNEIIKKWNHNNKFGYNKLAFF